MASCRNIALLIAAACGALTRGEECAQEQNGQDECTLVQNNVKIEPQLPPEVAKLATRMNAEMNSPPITKETGPFVFSSGTGAVRLPDNLPSAAWGEDKLKAMRTEGIVSDDLTGGQFITAGTDGKSTHHALAGAGYVGVNKKLGKPTAGGVLAAASVEPEKIEVVGAAPSRVNGVRDGGWDWSRLKAQVKRGHIHFDGHGADGKRVRAATKLESVQDDAPKAVDALGAVGAAEAGKPSEAGRASEAVDASEAGDTETQAATDELNNLYTLQLMLMDMPYPRALVFTIVRAWCQDKAHALSQDEELRRLRGIDGHYRILLDLEFPNSTGSVVVMKNGTLVAPSEKNEVSAAVRAYKEGRYGAIFPMKTKNGSGTLDVYRMFKVNGTQLQWDGGSLWQRVEPARDVNVALALEPKVRKVQAFMKVLGEVLIPQPAREELRKESWWAQLPRRLGFGA